MPIYIPYIKLLPLIMPLEFLYTDKSDNDADDDVIAQLHILSWPLGQISKELHFN